MKIPIEVLSTFTAYAKVFPFPTGEAGSAYEERLRVWLHGAAEQIEFDHGDHNLAYGLKKASKGRPISKDSIARAVYRGDEIAALDSWDMFIGAGTGDPSIADNPAHHEILSIGQVFVPVRAVNHLGGQTPEPEPIPTPEPPKPPAGPTYDEGVETARLCAEKWGGLHLTPELQGRNLVDAGQMFQWSWRMTREGWTRERILADVK